MSIGSGRCSGTETKPAPGSGSNRGSRPSLIWPAARSSASSTVGNSAAGEGVIDDQSQLVATPDRGRGDRPQGGVPVRGAFLAAPRPGSTLNISTRSSSPTTCSPRSAAASPGTPTINADAPDPTWRVRCCFYDTLGVDDPTHEISAAWGIKEQLRRLLACNTLVAARPPASRGMSKTPYSTFGAI